MTIFQKHALERLSAALVRASPFHHVVIDNLFVDSFLDELAANYPDVTEKRWWVYDNPLEKKFAFNKLDELHPAFRAFFDELNSQTFINVVQNVFDLNRLICDHGLLGGGLHQIMPGGKLDVHEDFNIHRELNAFRKLNVIVYLNRDWKKEYGGDLQLWNAEMTSCEKRVYPNFNRTVIFRTDMDSNHGHPDPLTCPDNMSRKSLAVYYYEPNEWANSTPYRSTVYKRRPQDPDDAEMNDLRERRKHGRIENKTT